MHHEVREDAQKGEMRHERSQLRERVDHVKDIVDDVRERAELSFRERPYLVPIAAGAFGFGVGVLVGSRLARLLVIAGVGTLLSETLGPEIKRISRDFVSDFQERLSEPEH
ncbi:MAG: hypothetical protein KF819_36550 [Labilithrix sp.]|nr:hypothetical protein [Labilithrix sp.]